MTQSAPPTARRSWFVVINKQRIGPMPEKDVRLYIERGRLTEASFVWRQGLPRWTRLRNLEEFQGDLSRRGRAARQGPPPIDEHTYRPASRPEPDPSEFAEFATDEGRSSAPGNELEKVAHDVTTEIQNQAPRSAPEIPDEARQSQPVDHKVVQEPVDDPLAKTEVNPRSPFDMEAQEFEDAPPTEVSVRTDKHVFTEALTDEFEGDTQIAPSPIAMADGSNDRSARSRLEPKGSVSSTPKPWLTSTVILRTAYAFLGAGVMLGVLLLSGVFRTKPVVVEGKTPSTNAQVVDHQEDAREDTGVADDREKNERAVRVEAETPRERVSPPEKTSTNETRVVTPRRAIDAASKQERSKELTPSRSLTRNPVMLRDDVSTKNETVRGLSKKTATKKSEKEISDEEQKRIQQMKRMFTPIN